MRSYEELEDAISQSDRVSLVGMFQCEPTVWFAPPVLSPPTFASRDTEHWHCLGCEQSSRGEDSSEEDDDEASGKQSAKKGKLSGTSRRGRGGRTSRGSAASRRYACFANR